MPHPLLTPSKVLDELARAAPDDAWSRDTIDAAGTDFGGRHGYAQLVTVTRNFLALLRQDLALPGGDCGASWKPIVTPGGG